LAMDRTTLTAHLNPLERRGLVEVQVDEKDRRRRRFKLTSAGRRLLAEAMPLREKAQAIDEELIPGPDPERRRADLRALSCAPLRAFLLRLAVRSPLCCILLSTTVDQ